MDGIVRVVQRTCIIDLEPAGEPGHSSIHRSAIMPRRELDLRSFDELVAEVQRLQRSGYTLGGQWDLSQACNHLAYAMNKSIDGYPFKLPLPIRILVPLFGKRSFFRTRKIRPGLPAPSDMAPKREDEAVAVAALFAAVERVKK